MKRKDEKLDFLLKENTRKYEMRMKNTDFREPRMHIGIKNIELFCLIFLYTTTTTILNSILYLFLYFYRYSQNALNLCFHTESISELFIQTTMNATNTTVQNQSKLIISIFFLLEFLLYCSFSQNEIRKISKRKRAVWRFYVFSIGIQNPQFKGNYIKAVRNKN